MSKKKISEKPMTPEMIQMANAKLFEYINSMEFSSIEEANEFISEHINGRRIDEILPQKKGRKSNKEKSDDLMYQAYKSSPKAALKLVEEALKLNPENINALNFLGSHEKSIENASVFYKRGLEIGKRQLGEEFFEKNRGHFWLIHETRPFMSAKQYYADCLIALGRYEEAISEYSELLVLNPDDNQGVRYSLASALLYSKKVKDLMRLLDAYKDEETTYWLFYKAFYLFFTEGTAQKANKALLKAHKANKHVIRLITDSNTKIKKPMDYYSPGDENEATYFLLDIHKVFWENPALLDWIHDFAENIQRFN